ncbi:hypothetical protein ACQ1ZK_16875, partial [Enterococcus faecium]
DSDDPLADQWVVTVVSPHFAAALAAREAPADGRSDEVGVRGRADPAARRLDYVLTYDRQRVFDAAGPLLEKVRPMTNGTVPSPAAADHRADGALLRVAHDDL